MEIQHIGHSSFKIKAKPTFIAGEPVVVITDPFSPKVVGLSFPKIEANIVTVSHDHEDHNCLDNIKNDYFLINQPGEYEIKGISVVGLLTDHDNQGGSQRGPNIVYVIEGEDIRLCHLGDLGQVLTERELEDIGLIDILMIPVGGFYTIGPKEAKEVINQISPSIVVPMHFLNQGINTTMFGNLTGLDSFLKENSGLRVESLPKLTITKDKIREGETVINILETKSGQ